MASAAADLSSIDADVAAVADARGKRPVWNALSNGSTEVGPVMGAISWPALSESAKASPKSPSSDSLKSLSDAPPPAPTGPLISSPTVKPGPTAPNPNLIQSPMSPARSKSFKRGGGGGSGSSSSSNGGLSPPPPQLAVSTDNARNLPDKQAVPEPSPKGPKPSGGPTPHHHSGPDHPRGYGGNRRGGNNGGGPHHNHGNRRDPDWNHPRGAHVQHSRAGSIRTYPRLPSHPVSASFISPPPLPIQPFVGNAMSFPDIHPHMYFVAQQPPPESVRGMSYVQQPLPPAMFFPPMDPQRAQLLKQIEYYYSSDNLCKDVYLRQNMDEQGWVPVTLIANFNRVKQLTNNMQYILDTVRMSNLVEVQGEKIRRRNDWMNWLLVPVSPKAADYDAVATHLQNVSLERGHADVVLTRSASGNLNNQYQIAAGDLNGEAMGQLSGFSDADKSNTNKTLSRCETL